jgi:DNA-binding response OmpR family regulator/predicted ATPase
MNSPLHFGTLTFHPDTGTVEWPNGEKRLNSKEGALLSALLREPDIPKSKEQLLKEVWGTELLGSKNRLFITLHRLKNKIASGEFAPVVFQQTEGKGYWIQAYTGDTTPHGIPLSDGHLDLPRGLIHRGGKKQSLSANESKLLEFLNRTPNTFRERPELAEHLWGTAAVAKAAGLKSLLYRCRQKIEANPKTPVHVCTGAGQQVGLFYEPPQHAPEPIVEEVRIDVLPFVGRVEVLHQLKQSIARGSRCLTLTGPGGVGKTRLTQMLMKAEESTALFGDAIVFCDLATCRTGADIVSAVANALALKPSPQLDWEKQVVELGKALALRTRHLIILDNFEQVAFYASQTLEVWVRLVPKAQFVVTSRRRLGLAAEQMVPLQPLPLADAMNLFLSQARRVQPGIRLGTRERQRISSLLERLQGNALALLIAAGQLKDQTFESWSESFGQQAQQPVELHQVVQRSWELLSNIEQTILVQTTAFIGGFTLEAAEEILWAEEEWIDEVLEALLDHSLLYSRPQAHGTHRYYLYESVREFAAEKCDALPDLHALRQRFGAYFIHFSKECLTIIKKHSRYLAEDHRQIMSAIKDRDNLWRTLEWNDGSQGGRGDVLEFLWYVAENRLQRIDQYLQYASKISPSDEAYRNVRRNQLARLRTLGRIEQAETLARAMVKEMNGELDHSFLDAQLFLLHNEAERSGSWTEFVAFLQHAARTLIERNPVLFAMVSDQLTRIHYLKGDIDTAITSLRTALQVGRDQVSWDYFQSLEGNMGHILISAGRLHEAAEILQRAANNYDRFAHMVTQSGIATQWSLGNIHLLQGHFNAAGEAFQKGLTACEQNGEHQNRFALCGLVATIQWLQGLEQDAEYTFQRHACREKLPHPMAGLGTSLEALYWLYHGQPEIAQTLWDTAEKPMATSSSVTPATWRALFHAHQALAEYPKDAAVRTRAQQVCALPALWLPRAPPEKQRLSEQTGFDIHWAHVVVLEEMLKRTEA